MEYFSVNAFYLGMLLFACMFMSNVFYSLICLIWKVKIIEFGIFSYTWYKEKVLGTEFILGWLPLGSHIRPLGMLADDDEKAKRCVGGGQKTSLWMKPGQEPITDSGI